MKLIDTHAHIDADCYDDERHEIIARAKNAGLKKIICVGTSAVTSCRCVQLAHEFADILYATVGIHPTYTGDADRLEFSKLEALAKDEKTVAIGETGLDYHHNYSTPEKQKDYFLRHLELAQRLDKPVIIHARKADESTLRLIDENCPDIKGVRHCFDSSYQMASEYTDRGFYVAFGGMITRDGHKKLKNAAARLDAGKLLLETDCPYMTPAAMERRRNEPAFIVETATKLAELRGVTLQDIAEITTRNAEELFGIR
jgi:TatD DNase family protein